VFVGALLVVVMSRVAAVSTDNRTLLTSAAAAAVWTVIYDSPFGLPAAAAAVVYGQCGRSGSAAVYGQWWAGSIYCGHCLTGPWHGAMTSTGGWGALCCCRSVSCT
jgi:hypothetical protein